MDFANTDFSFYERNSWVPLLPGSVCSGGVPPTHCLSPQQEGVRDRGLQTWVCSPGSWGGPLAGLGVARAVGAGAKGTSKDCGG